MKKSISLFLVGIIFLSTAGFAKAAPFFTEGDVQVPKTCEVTDTGGILHTFPKETSPSGFLGICAIVTAKEAGIIESFEFIDFGFGLFLNSINGIATSDDWDLSWSLYHNGEFAQVGLADLVIAQGDTFSFIYTSFSTGEEFDKIVLNIIALTQPESTPPPVPSSGGWDGSIRVVFPQNLDVEKAVQFLAAKQNSDGSMENPMFTDWAALAFAAYNPEHKSALLLENYLLKNPDPGQSLGSPVLSFARRAMALMALGINPYSETAGNYIQKIVDTFDDMQVGDPVLVNDDIFALLVLCRAGFGYYSDDIIKKTAQFIMGQQKPDGSFAGGVDMTAAAVQALSLVSEVEGASSVIAGAKMYLQDQQQTDGGFGNPDSTSWAMQAVAALGEDWRSWKKNGNAPGDYLNYTQKQDGSVESANPVWSTAYAIPAAIDKPWGLILNSFPKQEVSLSIPSVQNEGDTAELLETEETEMTIEPEAEVVLTEELERIAQELTAIKEQALLLEAKIALLAEAEFVEKAQEKKLAQEREALAEQEKAGLPSFNDGTGPIERALSAQVGAFAGTVLPYGIAGIIFALAILFFTASIFMNLWKRPQNKREIDRVFAKGIKYNNDF